MACGTEVRNLTLRGGQATTRGNPGDRCLDRARPGRGRQRRARRARPRRGGAPPRGRGPAHPRLRSHLPPGTAPILGATRARLRDPRGREPRRHHGRIGHGHGAGGGGIRGARRGAPRGCRAGAAHGRLPAGSCAGCGLRSTHVRRGAGVGDVGRTADGQARSTRKRAGVARTARRRGADLARTATGPTLTFRIRRLRVPRRRAHVPARRRCGARARIARRAPDHGRPVRGSEARVCVPRGHGPRSCLRSAGRSTTRSCVRPDWVPGGLRQPSG